jgi:hemerythrin superfamily protein
MGTQKTTIRNGEDVIGFLKAQHEQIAVLFETVAQASGKERAQAFFALRRLLAVHETAEEEIVHPAARRDLPDGHAVVAKRLAEERDAKVTLIALEKLKIDSTEFEAQLFALQVDVLAHAESEETQEFTQLADALKPNTLKRMRKAVDFAESVAPTRPHPGVESQVANLLTGPFVAMLDRSRDALSAKTASVRNERRHAGKH